MEEHKPIKPNLRDRCREFLTKVYDDPWLWRYDGELPGDDDINKLVEFVEKELYRAGAIYFSDRD